MIILKKIAKKLFKCIFYLVEVSGGQIKVNQKCVKMSIN